MHVTGRDRSQLLRDPNAPVDPVAYNHVLRRRAAREPVALIRGWQEFWSLRFAVSPDTLIPRADSETLVEAAVARRTAVASVLDLGTGTGCLLLAALTEFPQAWGVGVDLVAAAAVLARRNAAALGLLGRAGFVCGRWDMAVRGRFDLVLCNPPYIASREVGLLMPEVARFEPRSALDGGADGLEAYRTLVAAVPGLLAPGGLAVLEVGAGQAASVCRLGAANGLRTATARDLAGIERAVLFENDVGIGPAPH